MPKKSAWHSRDTRVKDAMLFDAVDAFFDNEEHWHMMAEVVEHKGRRVGVSLRLLDFLCTVYAYREPCKVRVADGSLMPLLEVYETSLDAYGKSHYDCFRRTARLNMVKHGQRIRTTLGQLLFFKDIIANGIMDFALTNKEAIKAAMVELKSSQSNETTRRGEELGPEKKQKKQNKKTGKKAASSGFVCQLLELADVVPPVFSC
jgi:hypothetical protein